MRRGEEDSFSQFSWQFSYLAWLTNAKVLNQPQPSAVGVSREGSKVVDSAGRFPVETEPLLYFATQRGVEGALVVLDDASGDRPCGVVADLLLSTYA